MTSKIIVLDDDPTGSQTVHSCLLLTRWDPAALREALLDEAPLFFVLTNTRSLSAARAAEVTREVCRNLREVLTRLAAEGSAIQPLIVSRSDSTLRGHYPVETDVIAAELGPFDAHFLVPAFFEGGRITRDGIHYLKVGDRYVPVHETEFARDSVFGFRHSFLPAYVEEKTGGRIRARQVERFSLTDLRRGCRSRLLTLSGNACCVVDAEQPEDLARFAEEVRAAAAHGMRFLFRSAASLLTALAALPPQPVMAEAMGGTARGGRPGAVVVGSHVQKTTQQLRRLLGEPRTCGIEVDVDRIAAEGAPLCAHVIATAKRAHLAGDTPVIYTSRTERRFDDDAERLAFGEQVSAFLMDVVRGLPSTLGYLISKGGITSNDVLSQGLALRTARVLGQVLAGCSVVRCPEDHATHPGMPVVIFPGNVGDADALALVWQRMSRHGAAVEETGT